MKSLEIIKKYKLEQYFKILLLENESNVAPYHNLWHTLTVFENSAMIAESEEINKEQIRIILIAAMFHDFNHSTGKLKDSENVKNAILKFKAVSEEKEEDDNLIINIIKATEFPYVIENPDIYQQIIRDADMLQSTKEDWIQMVIIGLKTEFNKDLKEHLNAQINFISNIKLYTKMGNNIWNKYKNEVISDTRYLYDIIK
jgi:HD superfamily phosphodiesterase